MMHAYTIRATVLLFTITIFTLTALMPQMLFAKEYNLEVSGWIPYWRDSEGIKDAKKHIRDIDAVLQLRERFVTKEVLMNENGSLL